MDVPKVPQPANPDKSGFPLRSNWHNWRTPLSGISVALRPAQLTERLKKDLDLKVIELLKGCPEYHINSVPSL